MTFQRETDLTHSDAGRSRELGTARAECDVVGCRFRIKVWIRDQMEANRLVRVALDSHGCVLTPSSWPPQVGDVWMSGSGVLYAVGAGGFGLAAVPLTDGTFPESIELDELLGRRPELVWRDQEKPT